MSEATLIIKNAQIITLNSKQPTAQAIAARDGKIVAVGTNTQIQKHAGKTAKIIDCKGKTVVPGLVDCHVHMAGFGYYLDSLDLRHAKSVKEFQKKLKAYADRTEKQWILGGRWDHELFKEKRFPTRWELDEAVKDKPVFLIRVCGHIGIANSKALNLAGITKETAAHGANIDRDKKIGEPNGIVRETALDLIWKAVPEPSVSEAEGAFLMACNKAAEAGLTGVHWMLGSANEFRVLQKLASENKLPLRVYLGIPTEIQDSAIGLGISTDFGNAMLKIGFIKILVDGSLGGHTAALKEPYTDEPGTCGVMLYSQKELEKRISAANKTGLQVAIHVIGDHAAEVVLNAYQRVLGDNPNNLRNRVEHCSVLNPNLIRKMSKLGLIACVQPHFVVSDFWITDRVGTARARWVYAFRTMLHKGIMLISGSDCPVEPISPILGLWAAVARKSNAEESLTIEEALKTYTVNAAYASFDEKTKGTIEVGKAADLTVLSENPMLISPDRIKEIRVEMTIVDGKIVYSKKQAPH